MFLFGFMVVLYILLSLPDTEVLYVTITHYIIIIIYFQIERYKKTLLADPEFLIQGFSFHNVTTANYILSTLPS